MDNNSKRKGSGKTEFKVVSVTKKTYDKVKKFVGPFGTVGRFFDLAAQEKMDYSNSKRDKDTK